MKKIVEFKNASIKIRKKVIFENFDFSVNEFKSTAIVGPGASGKSTILKALCRLAYPTVLVLKDTDIANNYNNLYERVTVVFNDSAFVCETVYSELAFGPQNLNMNQKEIAERINIFATYFEIEDLLENDISMLSADMKSFIRILTCLIIDPILLALDDMFVNLTNKQITMILTYIKAHNITLLYTTSNIDELVYADYVYVLDKCKIVDSGTLNKVLKNEKLLTGLGLGLPFFTELSIGLKYYDVISKVYNTQAELEGALWK